MMALIDSCLASSMKPHVLMMTTSARAGSSVKVKPSRASAPSMTSLSTWFLEQPRLTKPKKLSEENIARLKKKITERKAKTGKVLGDAALRTLRKRLKREQRKRRALAQRLAHAQGKKKEAPPQPAAAAG